MTATAAAEWHIRVLALLESGVESEFQVVVLADATVGDFRDKLATKSCIEPQKQRLIFRGRLLADDAQKLADAGVSDGSALHMVARTSAAATRPSDSADTPTSGQRPGGGNGLTWHFIHDSAIQFPLPPGDPSLSAAEELMRQRQRRGQESARRWQQRRQPQPLQNMHRTIREVHRNFGADDGGEWVALTHGGQYYRIDHEAEPGRLLTDDELQRGRTTTNYPVSSSSDFAAYELLPGIVPRTTSTATPAAPADGPARDRFVRMLEHVRVRPSPAQVNELSHDLFEYVLPAIRAAPGRGDFRFGASDSLHPTYLARTTPNPVAATGAVLSNLGDAFVELGRSLQAVGAGWQAHGGPAQDAAESARLEEQAQSALRIFSELAVAAPLAIPFLQARLAQGPVQAADTPRSASAPPAEQGSGTTTPRANSDSMVSSHQMRIVNSHTRRRRRYNAFRSAAGAIEPPAAALAGGMHGLGGASLMGMRIGTVAAPAADVFGPARPQEAAQEAAAAPDPRVGATSGATRNSSAAGARHTRPAPTAVPLEIIIEPVASLRTQASSQPQPQQQQEVPFQGTNMGEVFARLFGIPAPPATPGAQSVRSDHSSGSMATEYSTNDASARILHVLGPAAGSTFETGPTIDSLFQQLVTRQGNPFATASVFLGTETRGNAHASRRASVSSNASSAAQGGGAAPPGSDAGRRMPATAAASGRGQPPDEPARPAPAAPAPRTGETRTRRLSSASSSEADPGEGSSRTDSGPSKRHRPDSAEN